MKYIFSSFSVIDTNDRYLRKITIGQSPTEKSLTRQVMTLFHYYQQGSKKVCPVVQPGRTSRFSCWASKFQSSLAQWLRFKANHQGHQLRLRRICPWRQAKCYSCLPKEQAGIQFFFFDPWSDVIIFFLIA